MRGKRLRTSLSDLRARVTDSDAGGHSPRPSAGHVLVTTAPREAGATRDLVLVGATVDEALARAGKFLDDALLADEHRLRVVHGHGTGRLRDALTGYFREHPLVASVSVAPEREGGGAATIVELKE